MRFLLLAVSLPLFILDQITKHWVVRHFPPPDEDPTVEIEVVPGFFWLHRLHNTGFSFGTLNGWKYANWVLGGIAVAALTAIVWMWRKGGFPTRTGRISAALLVSGICGNVVDRLTHGYVVDFLRFRLGAWYERLSGSPFFASFNVADSCISVAAVLLFITAFQKPPAPAPKEATT